jgi:hypothetical protein
MIQARIRDSRIEVQDPIPQEWEGHLVKILPLTRDEPIPDLEERLAALAALGPMESNPGEHEAVANVLEEMDRNSRESIEKLGGRRR